MTIEDIEKLLQLKKENPDMGILCMVDEDIFTGDWGFYQGKVFKIEKSFCADYNERIYFDKNDLFDELYCQIDQNKNELDIDYEKRICSEFDKIKREEKIIIWVGV
jgi:hypothetical protein